MINVTQDYLDNIYNDSTKTYCTVMYGSYDVTARGLATPSANSTQTFSSLSETLDQQTVDENYTDLEQNQWFLDGNVDIFNNDVHGWWSVYQSNSEGEFTTNPQLTYTWNENHSTIGIVINTTDPILEATIRWYDSSNNLLDTYLLENEDLEELSYTIENGVTNFRKIEIEITKVLPYHYAKIQEVEFGITYEWRNNITNIEVTEQIDHKSQELVSNQAVITLNNLNNEFNKYNPQNRLKYLQEGQKFEIKNTAIINGQEESVSLGVFYLTSWGNQTQYTSEFVANDLIYKLQNRNYTHSQMYTNATAQTIIDDLFTQFNLNYDGVAQYTVDNNVKNVTLTGYIPIIDYRTALQQICFALGACAYCDRSGKIVIKRLSDNTAVDTIGYSKKEYANDNELEKYSAVSIKEYNYSVGTDTETLFEGTLSGNSTITLDTPCSNISISGTYTSYTAYANCIEIIGASGNITITGKPYNIYEKYVKQALEDTTVGITKQEMVVDDIYLIGTDTTANYVANWLLTELQKYITNEFRWLGNPAIEIGDFVNVQVTDNLSKKAMIQSNKFNFNGALAETSEVVL